MAAFRARSAARVAAFPLQSRVTPLRGCSTAALSHIDRRGEASMVDVSSKAPTKRVAVAGATVLLGPVAFDALTSGQNAKGNVLATARVAGIMAAKRTADLIPLCHPLGLPHVAVELTERPEAHALDIVASATCSGQTGVEMEALAAASVAALTVYDMCKAACARAPRDRSSPKRRGWCEDASTMRLLARVWCGRSKGIVISDVRLLSKSGGKSGEWRAEEKEEAPR